MSKTRLPVHEGDLPAGMHPEPGDSAGREVWTGHSGDDEAVIIRTTVLDTRAPEEEYGAVRQLRNGRITGIDVARGLALLGMIAVHTLGSWNDLLDRPTVVWTVAAGNAAALFAVLAGVGITLSTGGRAGLARERRRRTRLHLAVRALLILLIGVGANSLIDPPVFNILPYYALLFLLAVPFLAVRKRVLFLWAGVVAVVGPLLQYYVRAAEPYERLLSPQPVDLVAQPLDVLGTWLFTGTYPVSTWLAFLLVGMAIGRMPLDRIRLQGGLLGYGTLLALLGWTLSRLLVLYLGGYEGMLYSEEPVTQQFIDRLLREGPDPDLPTSSLWWLSVAAPHTNTTFALMLSGGVAVAVFGGALLTCRAVPRLLHPLAAAGSMTLTLYLAHLAFLHFYPFEDRPWTALLIQVAAVLVIPVLWRLFFRRGPLEWVVSTLSRLTVAPIKVREPEDTGRHRS
ncbi:heparan-alpha-glucosaminide N-acetyltransferase domain-containing protein [Corynebacterium hylobatis]|uniref:heparan-alpha-glucosaminide N-acetyltransferase domain-containing protein n=1 Tax=Corynebacterium hylobatis TaxID=1859290 RepID=UPI001F49F386|nr:heparan-alpha-glucosaminide N-acetyltransferase domain-containing protein [Corynebacterium hylobatis]